MKKTAYFVFNVVIPLAAGGFIYLGWRSTELVVFRWIEAMGAIDLVLRSATPLPNWVLYSLPDGCWVYAYTSWMLLIWGRMVPWVYSGLALAVVAELGQSVGLVPGTYDSLDMVFYIGAFILSGVIYAQTHLVNRGVVGDGDSRVRQFEH